MKRRNVFLILLVTILHFALSVYLLIGSLNYIFPGKFGFDPMEPQTAVIFGKALNILGFPLFSLLLYSFGTLFSGFFMWVLLALNSLLWGAVIIGLYKLIDLMRSGRLGLKSLQISSRDKDAA